MFSFYNTAARKKVVFTPLHEKSVKIYSCGPTVYDLAHIGNFRSFVFADILGRSLRYAGYRTIHAVNITDVDDKTIKSTREKIDNASIKDLQKHTESFIECFFDDLKSLGVDKFSMHPKATEYIEPMLDLITRLVNKGFAYQSDGSVYYSLNKKSDYGKLSRLDTSGIKSGLRYNTDEYSKDDIRDFVLWKGESESEKISWPSKYGAGRPGWHLECSAMIHDCFQGGIDIHTGGIDLVFPHHENEIAQSEAAYAGDFVNYWLHCEHLSVDGAKMSKSLNNFYTLKALQEKDFHPLALRYFFFSAHYRQKQNFTLESLAAAQTSLKKIWVFFMRLDEVKTTAQKEVSSLEQEVKQLKDDFLLQLEDDLNMPRVLAVFHKAMTYCNTILDKNNNCLRASDLESLKLMFEGFDMVLNLSSGRENVQDESIGDEGLNELLKLREVARAKKDFSESDRYRDLILQKGYMILDTADGAKLQKR